MTEHAFEELVPRHKHDVERVHALAGVDREQLTPILPALIEWMADSNWPVAPVIAKFLFNLETPPLQLVSQLLEGDDGCAKWACLTLIQRDMPRPMAERLRGDFERLSQSPDPLDIQEEVDEKAVELLEWLDDHDA